MIPQGSIVKVVNTGALYTTYPSFLIKNGFGHLTDRYSKNYPSTKTGVLLYEGNHLQYRNTPVCIVEMEDDNRQVIVIGEYGLEIIEAPVLDEEIETSDVPLFDFIGI